MSARGRQNQDFSCWVLCPIHSQPSAGTPHLHLCASKVPTVIVIKTNVLYWILCSMCFSLVSFNLWTAWWDGRLRHKEENSLPKVIKPVSGETGIWTHVSSRPFISPAFGLSQFEVTFEALHSRNCLFWALIWSDKTLWSLFKIFKHWSPATQGIAKYHFSVIVGKFEGQARWCKRSLSVYVRLHWRFLP